MKKQKVELMGFVSEFAMHFAYKKCIFNGKNVRKKTNGKKAKLFVLLLDHYNFFH